MKERPILFSAPMVRAILNGTKTQTRRVCKSQPYGNGFHFDGHELLCHNDYLPPSAMLMDVRRGGVSYTTSNLEGWEGECPYGQPGDRLWVRETWMDLRGTGVEHRPTPASGLQRYAYAADTPRGSYGDEARKEYGLKWRPSIHMPRAVSRINLEVTGVRVERLQDISEADAVAEGIERAEDFFGCPCWKCYGEDADVVAPDDPVGSYQSLWESINGAGSWDANPWVWVVEFKRVEAA